MFNVRKTTNHDLNPILNLYRKVAGAPGPGASRLEDEISEDYVKSFISKSGETGLSMVAHPRQSTDLIIGEVHCYKPAKKIFSHVLTDLIIVVDPDFQGQGVGKLLFKTLIDEIKTTRKDILRVELVVRESDHKMISFYRGLDFRIEGRFERRIDLKNGRFESEIPMAWFNPEFDNLYFSKKS